MKIVVKQLRPVLIIVLVIIVLILLTILMEFVVHMEQDGIVHLKSVKETLILYAHDMMEQIVLNVLKIHLED